MPRHRQRYPPRHSPQEYTGQAGDRRRQRSTLPGVAVDAQGGPVIDPTANVLALVESANARQDDLREMNNARIDAELRNQEALADIRAKHQEAIDTLEAKRLDAVRTVDQLAARTEADRSAHAVTALATAAATTAETLRAAVNTSATNLATQLTNTVNAITERIAALEKSSYTGQGKQAVVDPQLSEMLAEMRALTASRALLSGKSEGMSDAAKIGIAAIGLFATLLTIGGMVFAAAIFLSGRGEPQLIYTPSPPGTLLPSTPPAAPPR